MSGREMRIEPGFRPSPLKVQRAVEALGEGACSLGYSR